MQLRLSASSWGRSRILFKWLNRRSQRRSFNWATFSEVLIFYEFPKPRIVPRPPEQREFRFV